MLLLSASLINKQHDQKFGGEFPHASQNRIVIESGIHCLKCRMKSRNKTKKYKTIRSIYFHYLQGHSDIDKMTFPSRDECIEQLQMISDAIVMGVLK